MKKSWLGVGLLVLGLSAVGLFGSGCDEHGNVSITRPILYITARSPQELARVASFPVAHTVTFAYPVDERVVQDMTTGNVLSKYMKYGSLHNVGAATITGLSWSADRKTLTMQIASWADQGVSDPLVELESTGLIRDRFGNELLAGTNIWWYQVGAAPSTTTTTTTTTSTTTTTLAPVWSAQVSGTTNDLYSIWIGCANNGWVVGDAGTIRYTTNGGVSWHEPSLVPDTTSNLRTVFFPNTSNGWAAGEAAKVWQTTDGGATWADISPSGTVTLWGVVGDSLDGWAYGENGWFKTTTNRGATWQAQNSATTNDIYGIFFGNANTGWTVGQSGMINHTTNGANYGGVTWTAQNSATTNDLRGIHFLDPDQGWVAGDGGAIRWSTNGGANWNAAAISPATTNRLNGVWFGDGEHGWAVGANGTVLRSTNSGLNWTPEGSGVTVQLYDTKASSSTEVWAVGANGTILKRD